jgi:hypothetical protein
MSFWDTIKKIGTAATNFIPVVGPMVSQGLGALLGGGGSGGAKDLSPEEIAAVIQQAKDSQKARDLTDSAVDRSRAGQEFAEEEYGKGEAQREGYRTGAMDFSSKQNPFAMNPATGERSGGRGMMPGGFDPNAKFMASMGMMPGPTPGFAPSTGYGGTGGYTPPNPTTPGPGGVFGGLFDMFGGVSEGGPMSQVMSGAEGGAGGMGSMVNRVMQRFGGQERGSGTDFITPSRRGSSIKRAM